MGTTLVLLPWQGSKRGLYVENCYSGHVAEIGHNSLRVNLSFVPFAAVSFFLLAIIELHNQPAGFQINSFEHDNNFCNCC